MRERLVTIGIVLFLLVDIILVAFAVRHVQAPPPGADAEVRTSQPPKPEEPRAPTKTRRENDSFGTSAYLSVAGGGTLIRATQGSCDSATAPVIEISANGGRTFQAADLPDVTEVLRIDAQDSQNLSLVGTNRRCVPGLYLTENGGARWRRTEQADPQWYMGRQQAVPRTVHAPGQLRRTPCDPLTISTVDNEILRILCDDGEVIGTEDLGGSWVALGRLPGAVAAKFTSLETGYAIAERPDCPAAVMETNDGGAAWDRLTCLGDGKPEAVAAAGRIVAAQMDGEIYVSTDDGSSWQRR